MKKSKALDLANRKAFKQGEDPNIYEVIDSYKTFENITDEEREALYNLIADANGISNEEQLTKEQYNLLVEGGYIEENNKEVE